jgi:hypothetical protein
MPKRTTVILDDDSYKRLINESIKRYGTSRAISKVINSLVKESTKQSRKDDDLLRLLYSKKVAQTTTEDFRKDRSKLSSRLETRS